MVVIMDFMVTPLAQPKKSGLKDIVHGMIRAFI